MDNEYPWAAFLIIKLLKLHAFPYGVTLTVNVTVSGSLDPS